MKRKICIALFVVLIALNIYDTYSTNILLNSGMCYEVNPIMRFFMEKMGVLTSMIVLKAAALLWFATFLIRAKTDRLLNILIVGLIICINWYAVGMYFLNYQAMLLLGGTS